MIFVYGAPNLSCVSRSTLLCPQPEDRIELVIRQRYHLRETGVHAIDLVDHALRRDQAIIKAAQDYSELQNQLCSERKYMSRLAIWRSAGNLGMLAAQPLCLRRLRCRVRLMIKFEKKRVTNGT